MKKYKILKEDSIKVGNHTLYRIKALIDFGDVNASELGGYIESEKNLSHRGSCWIYNDSKYATPEYQAWKRAEKAKEEAENEELLWPIVKKWLGKRGGRERGRCWTMGGGALGRAKEAAEEAKKAMWATSEWKALEEAWRQERS